LRASNRSRKTLPREVIEREGDREAETGAGG
jgi:hypothetical protein